MGPQAASFLLMVLAGSLVLAASTRPTYRPFDGRGNNEANPEWGAAYTEFLRTQVPAVGYTSTASELSAAGRPSARMISLTLMKTNFPNKKRFVTKHTSDMVTYIGQFFDHDLDKTMDGDAGDLAPIEVPKGDPFFDPNGLGNVTLPFGRSGYNKTSTSPYRQTVNIITSFIDGSLVYGSSPETSAELRAFKDGKMMSVATDKGEMLPTVGATNMSTDYMANDAGRMPATSIKAIGDKRGNVNPPITSFHTLWVREHNRKAAELKTANPTWDDEKLFQEARKWTIAYLQRVCFYEYVPALGLVLPAYSGYKATVNPAVDVFFSTVSYRYGHSEVNDILLRIDDNGEEIPEGHLPLHTAFFNPSIGLYAGIEPLLRGMSTHVQGFVEPRFSQAVQNYLFGLPGVNGTDLFARNIQRGRDHGIPGYNKCRQGLGLATIATFDDLTDDADIAAALKTLYGTPDNCDAYVCGLAEKKLADNHFGPLFNASLSDQYLRTRDGDWYYFENTENGQFTADEISKIKGTTFRDIIMRNTNITVLPTNIWHVNPDQPWPAATDSTTNDTTSTGQTVSLASGKYTLGWKFDTVDATDVIVFTVTAQGTGWVGLGVAADSGSGMVNADIMMVRVLDNGTVLLDDMWSTSSSAPAADTTLGCKNNVELVSSSQVNGVTTATFRRPLAASDVCDHAISKDEKNNLIYAWNPTSDSLTYHSSNRGKATVMLSSSGDSEVEELSAEAEYSHLRKHGILMTIAFCILLPLGFLMNKLKKSSLAAGNPGMEQAFFYMHIFFNVAAVALAAAGFGIPFAKIEDLEYSEVDYSHGKFGIAIMVLLFLQVVYPWMRPSPTPLTIARRVWELVHTALGRAILVMGLVNVAIGILIIHQEFGASVHFFACLAAVPVCILAVASGIADRLAVQSAAYSEQAAPAKTMEN